MAQKKPTAFVDRKACERVMFGVGRARRFTQDSPVLPDVWIKFAENLHAKRELLLTPFAEARPGDVRRVVEERLGPDPMIDGEPRELIYNQSTALVTLSFEELVRVILPMTYWWSNMLWQRVDRKRVPINPGVLLQDAENRRQAAYALEDPERRASELGVSADLLWVFRIVGFLAVAYKENRGRTEGEFEPVLPDIDRPGESSEPDAPPYDWTPEVEAVAELLQGVQPHDDVKSRIWTVNLNRQAATAIVRSSVSVKADAARRLFELSCKDLIWAVVDSGIDATHPAFRRRKEPDVNGRQAIYDQPFELVDGKWVNRTRIVKTYDFLLIRLLLNPARLDPPSPKLPQRVRDILTGDSQESRNIREELKTLTPRLLSGSEIDWGLLERLLEVPHDDTYTVPRNDHGTHCAGILAADWRAGESGRENQPNMQGICPDLGLYDLRVFDDAGLGDEFSIIAALQYIRYKNAHKDYFVIHGANLSMSIRHDVMNFACGRTPVCEEAERLVNNGVVVVTAAGNEGYVRYETTTGPSEDYRSISITDPGNADLVITVGATHRFKPHTYGVSYFSSRGPTGDGRYKPDLVAPGEKIESTVPNENASKKDGTSMATPHVSGAAALLMARYEELIGKPLRIKQILTSTTTDLGRERYFQGAGMLDILRALQSV